MNSDVDNSTNNPNLEHEGSTIIVLRDLLVDHTVFVSSRETQLARVHNEQAYSVERRLDLAGGAATVARIASVLSDGNTYLWGLVGGSPWGTFRSILEISQALDGSPNPIQLRGLSDSTDAAITTISRLVSIPQKHKGQERYMRMARFSDVAQLHVPTEWITTSARHHLERIHQKTPLSCVVINDLNMGALPEDVVKVISDFAVSKKTPLVARLRGRSTSNNGVPADVVVCTLGDWVMLTDEAAFRKQAPTADYWWVHINNPDVADDFARASLMTFPNAKNIVVLVGSDRIDGIVKIETNRDGVTSVASAQALSVGSNWSSHQVGNSDVFTGALAHGYASKRDLRYAIDRALSASQAYQNSRWGCMPSREAIAAVPFHHQNSSTRISSRRYGASFVPVGLTAMLSDGETKVPGFYSCTKEVIDAINELLRASCSDDPSDGHIVLEAPGGSGKSMIAEYVIRICKEVGWNAFALKEPKSIRIGQDIDEVCTHIFSNPLAAAAAIHDYCEKRNLNRPLVVIDEAIKTPNNATMVRSGVDFLDACKKYNIRTILIDADFSQVDRKDAGSQFGSRVRWITIAPAWQRPGDVVYAIALSFRRKGAVRIKIEVPALVAAIEWVCAQRVSIRDLIKRLEAVSSEAGLGGGVRLKWEDLP